jgi:chemotaxis family two-component system sensor kinase Cph1
MGNLFKQVKYLFWGLTILWTGIIVASLFWNLHEQKEKIFELAINSAYLTFEKDLMYRRWVAQQGGVYVPVSKYTPSNPYLKVPERDIFTSSGLQLTLVNPAYMTRQVNEMAPNIHSRSRITSLNPIRPQNSPDPWETSALKSFEKGSREIRSVDMVAGEENLRVMRPFITEKACLKCHASQGYKEGDIRGGIGVSIPMAPLQAIESPFVAKISIAHLLLWIAGISGIVFSKKSLAKQILARERVEKELIQSEEKLQVVADFTYDWEYWRKPDGNFEYISPSCERITGYTSEEFIQNPDLYLQIIHPDDSRRVSEHFREDLFDCPLCEMEFRIIHRDGRELWIGHVCRSVLDAQGQILGRRASDRDITVRKRAEEELRKSRDELGIRVQERTAELFQINETLRNLSSKLMAYQENERHQLSLEVHDVLGSSLSAIKFKAEEALKHLPKDGTFEISKPLEALITLVRETIEKARRIQADLRPPLLDDLGILATLSWFCRRFKSIYPGIEVDQTLTLREEEVPDHLKIAIFRITQEAMNNIGKHAKADLVYLVLRKVNNTIEFSIKDNGEGLDQESLSSGELLKKGLGLSSMKERAELLGGSFSIDSAKGKGTVIRAVWPV